MCFNAPARTMAASSWYPPIASPSMKITGTVRRPSAPGDQLRARAHVIGDVDRLESDPHAPQKILGATAKIQQ